MRSLVSHWTLKAALCALTLLALLTTSRVAGASNRTQVWYDHSGAPAGYSRDDMHTLIALAIREWEEHSDGQIVWRFMGDVNPGERIAGPSAVTVVWDAGLGSSACGSSWGFCPGWPSTCTIALNPGMLPFGMRTAPNTAVGTPCGLSPYATILHEMAHLVYPTASHFDNSVLGSPPISDVAARHLWNRDMTSVGGVINPASPLLIDYDEIDSAGTVIDHVAGTTGSLSGEYGNYVSSLGLGPAGSSYARASALARSGSPTIGVFFESNPSGDLRTWTGRRMISGGTTRHHTCVVSDTVGSNVYVVFADGAETPQLVANEGSRAVMYAESHDGGNTWSAATNTFGLTRAGVTCSFDAANGRVVVGVSGLDERLWFNHRVASSVGVGGWAGWAQLDVNETTPTIVAFSPYQPQISFDPFSPSVPGVVSWFDWQSFSHRIERLRFNAGLNRYEFAPPPGTVHPRATVNDLETSTVRGPVIPNQIDVLSAWGISTGGLFCPTGGCPRMGRTEGLLSLLWRHPSATSSLAMPWTGTTFNFPAAPTTSDFQSFGDAAPNRVLFRNAYLRFILRDSF